LKLEYVASGVSFVRLNDKKIIDCGLNLIINEWINKLQQNHKFSLLYNAYQEANYPDVLKYFDVKLYSDSGGLQMIRKGMELTDEVKEKIYDAQTKSDYAFCFDEIPMERISDTERIIFKDKFFEAGQKTGRNIKKQVDYFRKTNAKTKAFIILQGQEIEDYMNYYKGIRSQLSDEDFEYIEGLSFSVACSGGSNYSTLKAIFASFKIQEFNDLPDRVKKRIHYLGFGSTRKFVLIKELSKHFCPDLNISADSTSATRGYYTGFYQTENKILEITRYNEDYYKGLVKDPVLEEVFKYIQNFIKKYNIDVDFEIIKKVLIKGTYTQAAKLTEEEFKNYLLMHTLYFLSQVDNVMEGVEKFDINWLENTMKIPYTAFLKVNNIIEADKLILRIVGKPKNIHQRVCSIQNEKKNKFNELF
jgi:hypothetical protein